jgi:hypothetical protein
MSVRIWQPCSPERQVGLGPRSSGASTGCRFADGIASPLPMSPSNCWRECGGSCRRSGVGWPDVAGDEGRVQERSIFSGLFKNPIKAVNPARPVLPTNSLLLASHFRRKRRLKSQNIGR